MSKFDIQQFLQNPNYEVFLKLKKDDLVSLGKHYNLTVNVSMKKEDLCKLISEHLVKEKVFKESDLEALTMVSADQELPEKYKYELELKKLEYQMEKEREREEREREREERERTERLEIQRLQHELEMRKLEVEEKLGSGHPRTNRGAEFDVTKHIRLVPPFQERDADKYFLHFEKVAENLKWPKHNWTLLLQSVLIGKARDVYTQLSVDQASDYDSVKELILKGYELVPEAYRQKFRNSAKQTNQTYVEFARNKEQLFDRWCTSEKVDKDHDRLRHMVLVEEFKRCIHGDIRIFINEKKAETLADAARLADDYSLTHKVSFVEKSNQHFSARNKNSFDAGSTQNSNEKPHNTNSDKDFNSTNKNQNRQPTKYKPFTNSPICNYCKIRGHVMSDCRRLKRVRQQAEQGQTDVKPTGFITSQRSISQLKNDVRKTIKDVKPIDEFKPKVDANSDSVMEIFEPFIHDGFISLNSDLSKATLVKILRDTGSSQSLILAQTLPFSDESFSGENVLIKGVDSVDYTSVPLHNVYLSSNLISGPITVGVRSSLPFEGVNFLLGNDLAGDKVVTNPIVASTL